MSISCNYPYIAVILRDASIHFCIVVERAVFAETNLYSVWWKVCLLRITSSTSANQHQCSHLWCSCSTTFLAFRRRIFQMLLYVSSRQLRTCEIWHDFMTDVHITWYYIILQHVYTAFMYYDITLWSELNLTSILLCLYRIISQMWPAIITCVA